MTQNIFTSLNILQQIFRIVLNLIICVWFSQSTTLFLFWFLSHSSSFRDLIQLIPCVQSNKNKSPIIRFHSFLFGTSFGSCFILIPLSDKSSNDLYLTHSQLMFTMAIRGVFFPVFFKMLVGRNVFSFVFRVHAKVDQPFNL